VVRGVGTAQFESETMKFFKFQLFFGKQPKIRFCVLCLQEKSCNTTTVRIHAIFRTEMEQKTAIFVESLDFH
jgi:hypothetical protein